MTKAERLAKKVQQEKEALAKKRESLAQNEAALREEVRRETHKRRYEVGALADAAGLMTWSNDELAALFARAVATRELSADLLPLLLAEPESPGKTRENGVAASGTRVSAAH